MGQTVGFAVGSWIVRQVARLIKCINILPVAGKAVNLWLLLCATAKALEIEGLLPCHSASCLFFVASTPLARQSPPQSFDTFGLQGTNFQLTIDRADYNTHERSLAWR